MSKIGASKTRHEQKVRQSSRDAFQVARTGWPNDKLLNIDEWIGRF
jgi:hypothetical protein